MPQGREASLEKKTVIAGEREGEQGREGEGEEEKGEAETWMRTRRGGG